MQYSRHFQQSHGKELQREGIFRLYTLHSHSRHGIYLREDRILFRRKISHNGRNQAITFSFCFIAGSPGRVAIRPDFFFAVPLFFTGYFAGLLSFVSRSGKEKKQRNLFFNRIFSLLSSVTAERKSKVAKNLSHILNLYKKAIPLNDIAPLTIIA